MKNKILQICRRILNVNLDVVAAAVVTLGSCDSIISFAIFMILNFSFIRFTLFTRIANNSRSIMLVHSIY